MQPRDLGLEAAKIRDFVPEFQGYNRATLPSLAVAGFGRQGLQSAKAGIYCAIQLTF